MSLVALDRNAEGLPRNPGRPQCKNYMATGVCKLGIGCSFDHSNRQNVVGTRSFQQTRKKAGAILGKVELAIANMNLSSNSTTSSYDDNNGRCGHERYGSRVVFWVGLYQYAPPGFKFSSEL